MAVKWPFPFFSGLFGLSWTLTKKWAVFRVALPVINKGGGGGKMAGVPPFNPLQTTDAYMRLDRAPISPYEFKWGF